MWQGEVQVRADHYLNEQYLSAERFVSLREQLMLCLHEGPETRILEIGPGPGMLSALLRHFGRSVTTLDFAPDLSPDIVACLPNIPLPDRSVDLVCAFEVLEHLPLDQLECCLRQMMRVAREKVVISVPDLRLINRKEFNIGFTLGRRQYRRTLWAKTRGHRSNTAEHYWEIGAEGITEHTVLEVSSRIGLLTLSHHFSSPWFHTFEFKVPGEDRHCPAP